MKERAVNIPSIAVPHLGVGEREESYMHCVKRVVIRYCITVHTETLRITSPYAPLYKHIHMLYAAN